MVLAAGRRSSAGGKSRRLSEMGAARLLERLLPSIFAWAHGRLPDRARRRLETADLVQEAAFGALQHLPPEKLDRAETVRCYLQESIRNRIVDEIRCAERTARRDAGQTASSLDTAASPLEVAIESEDRRLYRQGLLALDDDERVLIVGRVDLGLSYQQLAFATGRPSADAARVASRRAILNLAREVGRLRALRR